MTEFGPLFVPEELLDAVSGRAWLQAMLEFERALARAEATAGVVPVEAADAIADRCRGELYDFRRAAPARGAAVGSPPEPLVRALRDEVGGDAARYVHWGATSQDVIDTASMLVARRASELIVAELDRRGSRAARGWPTSHRVDAHGGADPAAAGGADDVRPQGGGLARLGARSAQPARGRRRDRLAVAARRARPERSRR